MTEAPESPGCDTGGPPVKARPSMRRFTRPYAWILLAVALLLLAACGQGEQTPVAVTQNPETAVPVEATPVLAAATTTETAVPVETTPVPAAVTAKEAAVAAEPPPDLAVELPAQTIAYWTSDFPESGENFTLIRYLGTFNVLDREGAPLSQPSAVHLVVTYTADDVKQASDQGERLLLGIWFASEEDMILWTSQDPVYPTESSFSPYWQSSGLFTFEIEEPNPEGGLFTLDISGDLSDPGVGMGSG